MVKITTATGKQFDTDYCVEHEPSNSLYLTILGEEIETVQTVFSDPVETARLEYVTNVYEGFTTLASIKQQTDSIKMRLCQDG